MEVDKVYFMKTDLFVLLMLDISFFSVLEDFFHLRLEFYEKRKVNVILPLEIVSLPLRFHLFF